MSIFNNGHSGEKDDQAVASIKVHACPIYFPGTRHPKKFAAEVLVEGLWKEEKHQDHGEGVQ